MLRSTYGKSLIANAKDVPAALMYGAQVGQDINCRTVGRCIHGAEIDREIGDFIPRDDADNVVPIAIGRITPLLD